MRCMHAASLRLGLSILGLLSAYIGGAGTRHFRGVGGRGVRRRAAGDATAPAGGLGTLLPRRTSPPGTEFGQPGSEACDFYTAAAWGAASLAFITIMLPFGRRQEVINIRSTIISSRPCQRRSERRMCVTYSSSDEELYYYY